MTMVTFFTVLVVLSASFVLSQPTTDDSDTSLQHSSLQLEIAQLKQQHLQMTQLLAFILDQQQQLQRLLTNRLGM